MFFFNTHQSGQWVESVDEEIQMYFDVLAVTNCALFSIVQLCSLPIRMSINKSMDKEMYLYVLSILMVPFHQYFSIFQ